MKTATTHKWLGMLLLMTAVVASCGPPPFPRVIVPREAVISAGPTADTVRVAVFETVSGANAPRPTNEAESLVFRHLYETLVGNPGLAGGEAGHDGRAFTFVIRDGARFWNGTRVTASDVLASWRDPRAQRALLDSGIDSVTAVDARTLRVYVARDNWSPAVLRDPIFAVARPWPGTGWMLGSGPFEVLPGESTPADVVVRRSGGRTPRIRFLTTDPHHARDILEGDVDLMVTRDRDVIDYAAVSEHYRMTPLHWDRTYLLLAPARALAARVGDTPPGLPDDLTARLAADVVPGDARGGAPRELWDSLSRLCGDSFFDMPWLPSQPPDNPGRRIVYDRDDAVARSLAERIVALSARGEASVLAAVPGIAGAAAAAGLPADEMAQRLRYGDDVAYVVAVDPAPVNECRQAREFIESARWLAGLEDDLSEVVVPLVTTRAHAIVVPGRVALVDTWDGVEIVQGYATP